MSEIEFSNHKLIKPLFLYKLKDEQDQIETALESARDHFSGRFDQELAKALKDTVGKKS